MMENVARCLAGLGRRVITIDASGNDNPVVYASVEMNSGSVASPTLVSSLTQQPKTQPIVQNSAASTQPLPSSIAPLPSFVSDAFHKLTKEYEIVLINTAPLLCSAETEYLSRCADVTILVATASRTKKDRLHRAARVLERIDVPGVAAILSEVSLRRANGSLRNDVQDFESRGNTTSLRWKSKFTPFVVGGAYCNEKAERAPTTAEESVAG
jgi:Mrp family chromosome partitioning ATPase